MLIKNLYEQRSGLIEEPASVSSSTPPSAPSSTLIRQALNPFQNTEGFRSIAVAHSFSKSQPLKTRPKLSPPPALQPASATPGAKTTKSSKQPPNQLIINMSGSGYGSLAAARIYRKSRKQQRKHHTIQPKSGSILPAQLKVDRLESPALTPPPSLKKTLPKPLSKRVSTRLDTLAASGKKVGQVFQKVILNSEITMDSGSSSSEIISKERTEITKIRKEHDISQAEDLDLERILTLQNALIKASASKDPTKLAETMREQGFEPAYTQDDLIVWKAPSSYYQILTDNSNFKGLLFLSNLEKLQSEAQLTMKDLNPTINKLCTTVGTNQDSTFCGAKSGILVYVSPQSPPLSASMCDALSITEHWNSKDKEFALSRQYGWGYYLDQNKYNLGYDWIRKVQSEYIQELETLLSEDGLESAEQEKIKSALASLRQKPVSILKRELLTTEEIPSELELQLKTLIKIGKEFPQFEKTELHGTLKAMRKTASAYAKHKDVIIRSVVKKEVSVWGVSNYELVEKHPLVSLPIKLNLLKKEVMSIYPEELDLDIVRMDPDTVSQFLEEHRDTYFDRNVGKAATSHSTVTDVVKENAAFKAKMISMLKNVQDKVKTDFPSTDTRANKIVEDCAKLITQISEMYTEIQFYTVSPQGDKSEMPVSGFGLKEPLVKEAMSDAYLDKEKEYIKNKEDLDKAKKQGELLRKTEGELREYQRQTSDIEEQAVVESLIDKGKQEIAECQAFVSDLQRKIDHFEGVKLTRKIIEECHKRNIPCCLHIGPTS